MPARDPIEVILESALASLVEVKDRGARVRQNAPDESESGDLIGAILEEVDRIIIFVENFASRRTPPFASAKRLDTFVQEYKSYALDAIRSVELAAQAIDSSYRSLEAMNELSAATLPSLDRI